jgi:RNA polymerase sigma-70 factor (ECF subfamily)
VTTLNRSTSALQPAGEIAQLGRCAGAFEAEFDYICRSLRRHGVREADAEDLAQEVFLVMLRRWEAFDGQRPLRPWLAGIAYRVAYNHRERVRREVPGGLIDREDAADGPEEHLASARARGLVLKALDGLPEKQRTVMILHELDGVSPREIATLLVVPLFTVYSRLRLARRAFGAEVKRLLAVAAGRAEGADDDFTPRPALLLAEERVPPAMPAESRRRASARARAILLLPAAQRPGADSMAPGRPLPRLSPRAQVPGRGLPLALGAATVAGLALVAVLLGVKASSPPPAERARTAASSSPARNPVADRAGRTPLSPVAAPARLEPARAPEPTLAPLGEGLIGYWRFDDGYGSTTARDLSSSGNDCALKGLDPAAAWGDGPLAGALHVSGGWLECARSEALARASAELSIALWVKRTGKGNRVQALVTRQHGAGAQDSFHLGFSGDTLVLRSHLWRVSMAAPFPPTRGLWYHVVATHDRHRLARLFVNGVEIAHKKTGVAAADGGDAPLLIGAGVNGPEGTPTSERLEGVLDEVLIYDRALGPQEIGALAAGTQPRLSP